MIPALLITFREVIEASLIVATILGILIKLKQRKNIKTVWLATGTAVIVSLLLLAAGSFLGLRVQELYSGHVEAFVEGTFMIISALFITWAVFFLHRFFAQKKIKLLQKVKKTIEQEERKGLFILVFTAVFREGFEIVLFLSTIFLSSNPQNIFSGFTLGAIAALIVSFGLFSATLRLPVFLAFRTTSILLILFAAGMLARGIHEFAEVGILPEMGKITLAFVPQSATFMGDMVKAVFGVTRKMDILQLGVYSSYVGFMAWRIFFRGSPSISQKPHHQEA